MPGQQSLDPFTQLLSQYDSALASTGAAAAVPWTGESVELQRRLEACGQCLRLLESVWPRAISGENRRLPSPHFRRSSTTRDVERLANSDCVDS